MECQDCHKTNDTVMLRWPGYGTKSYPRCEPCGEKRVERERGNIARNFQTGPVGDVGSFDPMNAGEAFEEDDY